MIAGGNVLGELRLDIPGTFNLDNALLVVAMAEAMGLNVHEVLSAMSGVGTVAGRFERCHIAGSETELMLAKNPAGWAALLDMVAEDSNPVVSGINARIADGADPSWLWDVDFSQLGNRSVVATGDSRVESLRLADAFRARVIDATTGSFVFELTGATDKLDAFIELMRPLGLAEVSRTGIAAIARGTRTI